MTRQLSEQYGYNPPYYHPNHLKARLIADKIPIPQELQDYLTPKPRKKPPEQPKLF